MRRRIVLAIVGSVVATVALFGLPLAWAVGRAYQDELRLRLESAALAASPELTEPARGVTVPEPPLQGQGVRIAYYDTGGRRIAGIGPATADGVVRDALRGSNGLADHAVAVPVSRDDRIIGAVRAEERSGLLSDRVHNAWLLMGGLALVVVAAVTALATALVRRLTAPVHALADAAQRLEHGDFAVAPAPSGIAELDSAGLALAAAAQRLENVLARERALTSDVTHQLRTPLTALRLELEAGAARQQGPDVDVVLAQVDRLEATIASLLALAREGASAREPIELGPALRSRVRSLEPVRERLRADAGRRGRAGGPARAGLRAGAAADRRRPGRQRAAARPRAGDGARASGRHGRRGRGARRGRRRARPGGDLRAPLGLGARARHRARARPVAGRGRGRPPAARERRRGHRLLAAPAGARGARERLASRRSRWPRSSGS